MNKTKIHFTFALKGQYGKKFLTENLAKKNFITGSTKFLVLV